MKRTKKKRKREENPEIVLPFFTMNITTATTTKNPSLI